MTIVFWIVGSLAAVLAVVAGIGAFLPVAHAAARRVRLRAAPMAVFAAITDLDGMAKWRVGLKSIERLPDRGGRRCFREVTAHGPIDLQVDDEVPGQRLVLRIVTKGSPFAGTWTYRIEPDAAGAKLTISENGEVYNLVFRTLARFVFGHTRTLEAYLQGLGNHLGQEGAIEPATPDAPPPVR